jgi:hypothetical protein
MESDETARGKLKVCVCMYVCLGWGRDIVRRYEVIRNGMGIKGWRADDDML